MTGKSTEGLQEIFGRKMPSPFFRSPAMLFVLVNNAKDDFPTKGYRGQIPGCPRGKGGGEEFPRGYITEVAQKCKRAVTDMGAAVTP